MEDKTQEISDYLLEFREVIREDGGDFIIKSIDGSVMRLKIRGRRNKGYSRQNLKDLIEYAVNKKFGDKENKYRVEMEEWIVKDPKVSFGEKIKDLFKGGN